VPYGPLTVRVPAAGPSQPIRGGTARADGAGTTDKGRGQGIGRVERRGGSPSSKVTAGRRASIERGGQPLSVPDEDAALQAHAASNSASDELASSVQCPASVRGTLRARSAEGGSPERSVYASDEDTPDDDDWGSAGPTPEGSDRSSTDSDWSKSPAAAGAHSEVSPAAAAEPSPPAAGATSAPAAAGADAAEARSPVISGDPSPPGASGSA
jgi:hypothetical protein